MTGIIDLPEDVEVNKGEIVLSDAASLFVPNGLDKIIATIKSEVSSHVPDISTERGRKAIASLARKVASSKTRIDEYGKEYVAAIKVQAVAVDAERKRMRDELDRLRDEVRKPLTDWENIEAARVKGFEDGLLALDQLGNVPFGATLAEITDRLDKADFYNGTSHQEFEARYKAAYAATTLRLRTVYAETKRQQEERAEYVRLQAEEAKRVQEEREQRIAAEAASRAKQQAEAEAKRMAEESARNVALAEQRIRQAEEAAEQAKVKAERDAEEARIRAEHNQARAIEQERAKAAHAKRLEEEAIAKRAANVAHCGKINREVVAALMDAGLSDIDAKSLVTAIVKGQIPHVSISY